MPEIEDLLPLFSKSVLERSAGLTLPYKAKVDPECSFCRKNRQVYLAEDEYEHPEPTFIKRLPVSVAALSYEQDYPGRTAIILRDHETSMSYLLEHKLLLFIAFMEDVSAVAEAIYKACKPVKVNYAVFMNMHDHFHMHLIPRYEWEGENLRKPPLFRGVDKLDPDFDYRSLALKIRHNIPGNSSQFSEYMERMIDAGLPEK
ncbi:HIT family protein [Methanocella conradii]|uniref:HIT family protein n=1 Tax=Methanocella conradii TaxID=1175444 RepID=UPI0024B3573E|nr:HIT family protein [Methanocella conradii]MDI6897400.1 HIT family protein [Methanocella conradii]